MANVLSIISIVSFALSGVFLLLSAIFWFRFDILSVIGDLSGRNAKKSIDRIRAANEKTGNKSYRPTADQEKRGKLTETIAHSGKLGKQDKKKDGQPETGLLLENKGIANTEATGLLDEENSTDLLDDDSTTLLEENQTPLQPTVRKNPIKMTVIEEVILVHTNESID